MQNNLHTDTQRVPVRIYDLLAKGFTLIELLVVIAIIGILSAVVLAALSTARTKGSDAGIKSNLHTVETQASIYIQDIANQDSYGTFADGAGAATACPAVGDTGTGIFYDPNVQAAIAAAIKDSNGGSAVCLATDSAYAVAVTRPADNPLPSTYWCVDSSQNHCGVNDNALTGTSCGTCVSQD